MPITMTLQAVVDEEFRTELMADPAAFGVTAAALPEAIEQPDQDSIDFWTEAAATMDVYACASTCSSGPLTFICDGTTK